MILVVTDRLNLAFLLQHQGRVLHSAHTARDALSILRTHKNIEGVILDDHVPNSRLITGYIRNKMPNMQLISWQVAQRNSPFKNVSGEKPPVPPRTPVFEEPEDRYVWFAKKKEGELRRG